MDYISIDETYILSSSAAAVDVALSIIDDEALEGLEFLTVIFESNVSLSATSLLVFINNNDRK